MTRAKAIELSQRIRVEDDGLRARAVQYGRGSGYYVVIIDFDTSETATVIQNAQQWRLLRKLRQMTTEERELWNEYQRMERHEAELIKLTEEAINQLIREEYRKGA